MAATTLLLAVGNVLRGDDGVAARALELLGGAADVEARVVHGLTPELAEVVAGAGRVVILDADLGASGVMVEALPETDLRAHGAGRVLSHSLTPRALVALARQLYGFAGPAWICRLPVQDLAGGVGLSAVAEAAAREGARQLAALLEALLDGRRAAEEHLDLRHR